MAAEGEQEVPPAEAPAAAEGEEVKAEAAAPAEANEAPAEAAEAAKEEPAKEEGEEKPAAEAAAAEEEAPAPPPAPPAEEEKVEEKEAEQAEESAKAAAPPAEEEEAPAAEGGVQLPEEVPPSPGGEETLRPVKPPARQQGGKKPLSPGLQSPSLHQLSQSMGSLHNDKTPSHMGVLSHVKSGPAVSLGVRTAIERHNSNPGPGSYSMARGENHSRYLSQPKFSFGGASRFGMGANPSKEKPGPGHYGAPRDPGIERGPRACFSGAPRAGMADMRQAPGPGAYEMKSTVGGGKMFTAGGRHVGVSNRGRMPGPGAYDPSDRIHGKYFSSPKCGFGTSTRGDLASRSSVGLPGPGAYDLQSKKAVGSDSAKFSIRSRQRMHDLTSYVEPGPGHYASHASSFMGRTF